MKEVVVNAWCDGPVHALSGPDRVAAVAERVIAIGTNQPRLLDLCEGCIVDLDALFAAAGTIPQANGSAPPGTLPKDSSVCPVCGFESISRNALGGHLRRMHDASIKDFPKP